jgi:hypothetical protein
VYYPILEATVGRPYALYVHGGSDTVGAVRSVETIVTGLKWKRLRDPVTVTGALDAKDREACWELGATTAASLMP